MSLLEMLQARSGSCRPDGATAIESAATQQAPGVTGEYFAKSYQRGLASTIRFLASRGVPQDAAYDTAQAAWVKGWEKRGQLRDPRLLTTWTNSIALNMYRSEVRREPVSEPLSDLPGPDGTSEAAIDAKRIFAACRPIDREVLADHYINGYGIAEIAQRRVCTETAIRIRLFRLRRKLRAALNTPTLVAGAPRAATNKSNLHHAAPMRLFGQQKAA